MFLTSFLYMHVYVTCIYYHYYMYMSTCIYENRYKKLPKNPGLFLCMFIYACNIIMIYIHVYIVLTVYKTIYHTIHKQVYFAGVFQDMEKENTPDVVDGLEISLFETAQEYINKLDDPEEIYKNNGLFVDMLKYIYKNNLVYILKNDQGTANRYDYKLLDKVFNIYTSLVYKYKQNKRPSILEFTIFTKLDSNTFYSAANGNKSKLTPEDIANVKRWIKECENSLTNTDSVFSIFLLKSKYGYNDNLGVVPYENQGPTLTADQLPDFSSCHNATLGDKSKDKQT